MAEEDAGGVGHGEAPEWTVTLSRRAAGFKRLVEIIDRTRDAADDAGMKAPIALPTSSVARNALVLIAVVAAGAAVYWLRGILTPLAMAIFLMIMVDGVKRTIEERTPIPGRWAGAAALTVVVLGFLASIAIIVNGAAGFFDQATGITTRIGPRIDQILIDGGRLFGVQAAPTAAELLAGLDVRSYVTAAAMQAQGILSGAFFVMVYLAFLLAS
ncbi:MAG TPA: hypothetical protein VF686_09970, partial [Brevundimonas sp.]